MARPRVFRRAPERFSALRPPLDSGRVKQSRKTRAQTCAAGTRRCVCVLEIVRPGMEDPKSAEKQENTGIGPASACRGESAFTRVFHARWHAHGCSAEHRNVSRRSAHPSFGVSEAKLQTPGAETRRGNGRGCLYGEYGELCSTRCSSSS